MNARATWYVVVRIQAPDVVQPSISTYALGPASWSDARAIALRWEWDNGAGTTELIDKLPAGARMVSHAPAVVPRVGSRGSRVRPLWSAIR